MTVYEGAWCGILAGDPCRVVCWPGTPGSAQPAGMKWVNGAQEGYFSLGEFTANFPGSFYCPSNCAGCAGNVPPGGSGGPTAQQPESPEDGEVIPPVVVVGGGGAVGGAGPFTNPILSPPANGASEGPAAAPLPYDGAEEEESGAEAEEEEVVDEPVPTFPFASLDPWDWPGALEAFENASPAGAGAAGIGASATFLPYVVPPDGHPAGERLGETALSPQG